MSIHGGNTYDYDNIEQDFSANLSPLGMPEAVKLAIQKAVEDYRDYPDVNYTALKRKVMEYLDQDISLNRIVLGNGAADLIYRIPRGITGNKKSLIVSPAFSEYEKALLESGYSVEHFFLKEEKGFKVGEELIEKLSQEQFDILYLCNPANPTGVLTEKEFLINIAALCDRMGTYFCLDECFVDLTENPIENSLMDVVSDYPHLIILRTFTKLFAMAGLRLGYLITGNEELGKELSNLGQPWPVSKVAEAAAMAALGEKEYPDSVRSFLASERPRLVEALRELGMKPIEPSANYLFFFGPEDLSEKLIEKGILIRDCSNYPGLEKGAFRVAVKNRESNDLLIKAIKEIVYETV